LSDGYYDSKASAATAEGKATEVGE